MSVKDAMSRPDCKHWMAAMEYELQSFENNGAWEIADIPNSGCVVKCKWVFKRKSDISGKVRYRARLVAKGFTQKQAVLCICLS